VPRIVNTVTASVDPQLTAPNPIFVMPDEMRPELRTPCMLTLTAFGKTCQAFGYRIADFESVTQQRLTGLLGATNVVISSRVAKVLNLKSADVAALSLCIPEVESRIVISGLAEDLPDDVEVQYLTSDSQLCQMSNRGWVLATCRGMIAPVRLRSRSHVRDAARVRVSMTMRTLWGIPRGPEEVLQFGRLVQESFAHRISNSRRIGFVEGRRSQVVVSMLSFLVFVGRKVDQFFEVLLRVLLRAPVITVRTTQAQLGDDAIDIVIFDRSIFEMLGIPIGGQVIVSWGPTKAIAVALEALTSSPDNAGRTRRTELLQPTADLDFPQHLIARLSTSVRLDLRCPASTVVVIRRRVRPILIANLRQLIIPVASVVLAAAATDASRKTLTISFVLMSFFALVPSRYPRPPRGTWP